MVLHKYRIISDLMNIPTISEKDNISKKIKGPCSHVEFSIGTEYINFAEIRPMNIPTKFG
jgi:hypothetical protein